MQLSDSRRKVLIPPSRALALIILLAALIAVPTPAAEDAALLRDLSSVIMLLGMP